MRLRARLDDLEAATNVTEILAGHPRALDSDAQTQLCIDLADGYVLVLTGTENLMSASPDVPINWKKVTRVTILKIEKR